MNPGFGFFVLKDWQRLVPHPASTSSAWGCVLPTHGAGSRIIARAGWWFREGCLHAHCVLIKVWAPQRSGPTFSATPAQVHWSLFWCCWWLHDVPGWHKARAAMHSLGKELSPWAGAAAVSNDTSATGRWSGYVLNLLLKIWAFSVYGVRGLSRGLAEVAPSSVVSASMGFWIAPPGLLVLPVRVCENIGVF